jgi:hypothetical protein
MMHNVACIYALAVGKATNNPATFDQQHLVADYRAQAISAIRSTLAMLPAAERARFWREKIAPDPALDAIRGGAEYQTLDVRQRGSQSRLRSAAYSSG